MVRCRTKLALSLTTPPHTADGFLLLDEHHGRTNKMRYLGHKLVPPRDFMRYKYPIATRGWPGLALAYVYRPLWLAWWAPRGYLAWRRAKKVSSSE